ncbi:hypothetical protein MUCCIDRAFT_77628 [Mucor lusitanicus CBS 277.49]|uniref:Uncharacterized protein n=1 Tax=Mucor lusitanicus CBS 277.49 TaxID=747725 RepID=A0A168P9H1_MUCCL|nr:hypothetical protein MUCCIDRAFT_77628 [Mucor lusitanicus CBS 277.49]
MTVVYFPASRSDRSARFLSSILTDYASVFSSSPSRSIILGDFHHTYFNASSYRNRQALAPWLEYLDDHFVNGITAPGANPSITSRRGSTQSSSVGCIRLRMRRLLRLLAKYDKVPECMILKDQDKHHLYIIQYLMGGRG